MLQLIIYDSWEVGSYRPPPQTPSRIVQSFKVNITSVVDILILYFFRRESLFLSHYFLRFVIFLLRSLISGGLPLGWLGRKIVLRLNSLSSNVIIQWEFSHRWKEVLRESTHVNKGNCKLSSLYLWYVTIGGLVKIPSQEIGQVA